MNILRIHRIHPTINLKGNPWKNFIRKRTNLWKHPLRIPGRSVGVITRGNGLKILGMIPGGFPKIIPGGISGIIP